jgi:methionyl-tRNA synthetase
MAAHLPLPRQVLVHGHWTLNNLKMSKSLGNVVSPTTLLKEYHPDIIRYYMIKEGSDGDGNWNEESLKNRTTHLANSWGNLISRMMSPKMDLHTAVVSCFKNGEYRGYKSLQPDEDDKLRQAVDAAIDLYRLNMNNLNLEGALSVLDSLWRAVRTF